MEMRGKRSCWSLGHGEISIGRRAGWQVSNRSRMWVGGLRKVQALRRGWTKRARGLWKIGRTADVGAWFVEDVGVDHGGFHIGVTQEFLHGADVITVFEKVRGK